MERFIVSARKYRPNSFENLIGQNNIASTLQNSIMKKQLAHAYLFCGPRGVGKTTSARIFAKTINCLSPTDKMEACGLCESCLSFAEGRSYCIHELDAASNNSVEDIRLLNEKVRIPPQIGKYSVYIIDEVHMLSPSAFNAFLKTLEEPPAHAIFILATTEKHKIIPTILSRCQTYDFNRISVEDIVKNLQNIASCEGIIADSDSLHIIAQKADGAMRDALTIFDQMVAFCGKEIKYDQVIENLNVLDYEYYFRLTDCFVKGDYSQSLLIFDEILAKGFNSLHFIGGLSSHFRDLLLCKDKNTSKLLELSPALITRYNKQASECAFSFLFSALDISTSCEAGFKSSNHQRLHIEFALIKLSKLVEKTAAKPAPLAPAVVAADVAADADVVVIAPAQQEIKSHVIPPAENHKSSMMSIKKLMAQAENKAETVSSTSPQDIGSNSFDSAKLEEVWSKMVDSEKAMPRLATALAQHAPILNEDLTITFFVSNDLQKKWIDQNCLIRLNHFLRVHLDNHKAELVIVVKPDDSAKESKLYMPEEKAKFLLENNPELRELQKDLNLEIK